MTNPQKYHGSKEYRIKFEGCLGPEWSDWFGQMTITTEGAVTVMKGPLADQAALHGLLARIRDLNLTLLSVECIDPLAQQKQKFP